MGPEICLAPLTIGGLKTLKCKMQITDLKTDVFEDQKLKNILNTWLIKNITFIQFHFFWISLSVHTMLIKSSRRVSIADNYLFTNPIDTYCLHVYLE